MVRTPDLLTRVASENICCLHCMAADGENARPTDPCGFGSENICYLPCMTNIASPHYCCVKKCIESWGSKSLHHAFSGQLLCVGCIICKQGQPLCVNCIGMEEWCRFVCVCLYYCVWLCIFFFFRLNKKNWKLLHRFKHFLYIWQAVWHLCHKEPGVGSKSWRPVWRSDLLKYTVNPCWWCTHVGND